MDTHETYVSLEVAKLLKEAGFDWDCYKVYKTDVTENLTLFTYAKEEGYSNTSEFICSAPTLEVAQRWLREVKGIHLYVTTILWEHNFVVTVVVDESTWGQVNNSNGAAKKFNTYEEAQETGIKKALEIILEEGE